MERGIINLKTGYQTMDTPLGDGEKMVYFGPPWITTKRLIHTHPVGRGIPTRWSSIEL